MLVGCIVAAVLTAAIYVWALTCGNGDGGGLVIVPWMLIVAPTYWLVHAIGIEWRVESLLTMFLVVGVNALIGCIFGFGFHKMWAILRKCFNKE